MTKKKFEVFKKDFEVLENVRLTLVKKGQYASDLQFDYQTPYKIIEEHFKSESNKEKKINQKLKKTNQKLKKTQIRKVMIYPISK